MLPSTPSRLALALCASALLVAAATGSGALAATLQADAGDGAYPQPSDGLEMPERVVLGGSTTGGSTVVETDAGVAMDRSGTRLSGAYERYLLEERLDRAEDDAERRRILNRSTDEIERRLDELLASERSAREAYRAGEIDEATYLSRLQSINVRATELELRASRIAPPPIEGGDGLTDEHDAPAVATRIGRLRGDLAVLQGPVRTGVGDSMSAESDTRRFYVATSPNGTVLSVLDDGVYEREAIRPGLLTSGATGGITLGEASDLAESELYPLAFEQYTLNRRIASISARNLYLVSAQGRFDGGQGTLRSYIDATSANVFWEYHRIEVGDGLPVGSPVENASDGLGVAVRPTYPSGPALVTVGDNGTVAPNATVTVGGDAVATTDEAGEAWVLLPNENATVSVREGDRSVTLSVDWEADVASPDDG